MRALAWFWGVFLAALIAGAATLQVLGPPPRAGAHRSASLAAIAPAASVAPVAPVAPAAPVAPVAAVLKPIAPPDPALLEPSPAHDGTMLPKIAGGRLPRQVYALQPADGRSLDGAARIGLVQAGVGLNEADSLDAIRTLPSAVTLAVSPYATHADALLDAARQARHELLISLPLEPSGWYVNDPGDHTLLAGAPPEQNRMRLFWALSRIQGYVGATGALGDMRGERFASAADQMEGVLDQLGGRGLLYVDARIGAGPLPHVWSRGIDVVVDEPSGGAEIDASLMRLEQVARDHGAALGLVGVVRPGSTARIAAWARGLADRGAELAPVSALAEPPATQ
jgi:polysaccharide deacetylase 2 family uncharacterized protein YibQ